MEAQGRVLAMGTGERLPLGVPRHIGAGGRTLWVEKGAERGARSTHPTVARPTKNDLIP